MIAPREVVDDTEGLGRRWEAPMGAPSIGLPRSISVSTEQLLDSAPDGVVIVDAAGLIRLVNRQAEAMFGYAREELLGQPIEVLVPERAGMDHREHRDGYVAHPTGRLMG